MTTIPLPHGVSALVDDVFCEIVALYSWYLDRRPRRNYAFTYDRHGLKLYLHRLIMGGDGRKHIDHKNGSGLDCRLENLRFATHSENMRNRPVRADSRSRRKGVAIKRGRKCTTYEAYICCDSQRIGLGTYGNEFFAALARDYAARRLDGEFAYRQLPNCGTPKACREKVDVRLAAYGY